MTYSETELQQVEQFASIYLKISDMAVILGVPAEILRSDIADHNTEVSLRYRRGKAASKVKLLHQEMMLALDHKATNKTLKLWAISLILSIVGFFLLMYAVAKIGGCENSGSEPSRGSDSTAYEEQWQQQSVPASYASEEYEQAAEAEPAIEYQYSEEKTAAE